MVVAVAQLPQQQGRVLAARRPAEHLTSLDKTVEQVAQQPRQTVLLEAAETRIWVLAHNLPPLQALALLPLQVLAEADQVVTIPQLQLRELVARVPLAS